MFSSNTAKLCPFSMVKLCSMLQFSNTEELWSFFQCSCGYTINFNKFFLR